MNVSAAPLFKNPQTLANERFNLSTVHQDIESVENHEMEEEQSHSR